MKNRMSETRHGRLERCIFCQRKERPCTAVDDGSAPLSHVFVCLSKAGRGALSLCHNLFPTVCPQVLSPSFLSLSSFFPDVEAKPSD